MGNRTGIRVRPVRSGAPGVHGPQQLRAEAIPASDHGDLGRLGGVLAGRPARPPRSLGTAISDAVRAALRREDTHYALGSVLNHVLLHQTVIGLEVREQLTLAGERLPDVVIAPCGGGSNLAKRPAKRKSSCSTTVATGSSTCQPTMTTSMAGCLTTKPHLGVQGPV